MSWWFRSAAGALTAVLVWIGGQVLPLHLGPDARASRPGAEPAAAAPAGDGDGDGAVPVPMRVVAGLGDSLLVRPDSWFRRVCATGGLGSCLNAGLSGDTTPGMLDRLGSQVLAQRPAAMVLMGGTNDVPKDTPTQDIIDELDLIVATARAAGVQVVLCTVPPRDRYRDGVLELNEGIRRYATESGVPLLDMYDVVGTPEGEFADGMSDDGIHPNEQGNDAMAAFADTRLPTLLPPPA